MGDLLRELRERKGLTQAQLAKEVGTTQSVISRLENPAYCHYTFNMVDRVLLPLGYTISLSEKILVPTPRASASLSNTGDSPNTAGDTK